MTDCESQESLLETPKIKYTATNIAGVLMIIYGAYILFLSGIVIVPMLYVGFNITWDFFHTYPELTMALGVFSLFLAIYIIAIVGLFRRSLIISALLFVLMVVNAGYGLYIGLAESQSLKGQTLPVVLAYIFYLAVQEIRKNKKLLKEQ